MPEHVVAAQVYTVREFLKTPAEVAKSLKKVADIGYTAIQDGFAQMDPKEAVKAVRDSGLKLVSVGTTWDRCLHELDELVEESKLANCHHLVIPGLSREYYSLDGLKRFLDELSSIAPKSATGKAGHLLSQPQPRAGQVWWQGMVRDAIPAGRSCAAQGRDRHLLDPGRRWGPCGMDPHVCRA